MKYPPGRHAENIKEKLLPLMEKHINSALHSVLEDPPAVMIIFFENVTNSRTHYKTNAADKKAVVEALRKTATLIEHNYVKPPGDINPQNN